MSDALVYQGDRLVAQIEKTWNGSVLRFEEDVVREPPTFPGFLATTIPYSRDNLEVRGENLHPFFLNLLPEGARLIALIGRRIKSRDDLLSLLLEVGQDTVGDVSVVRPGEALNRIPAPLIDPSLVNFRELLDNELAEGRGTVPGVQEKISNASISFPVKTQTSAAILKLDPPNLPLLIRNEEFFLRMARGCGVQAAKAKLAVDKKGETGLLVERFDRRGGTKRQPTIKFHQEDGCQLLDAAPANKYTSDFTKMHYQAITSAACRCATTPKDTARRLIELYAFAYLIGNADLHAKNVSMLWRDGVVLPSPAYDMLSTLPYPKHDRKMALAMDGKDDDFSSKHMLRFADRFDVAPAVKGTLMAMTDAAVSWIPRLGEIGYDSKTTEKLASEIGRRRTALVP